MASYSRDAERDVIGACLLGPDSAVESAAAHVAPDDFYYLKLGTVFGAILELAAAGKGHDPVSVTHHLTERGITEPTLGELVELAAESPTFGNVAHHARIVRDLARNRHEAKVAAKLAAAAEAGGLSNDPDLARELAYLLTPVSSGSALERLDLDELLSGEPPETNWLWGGLIGRGDLAMVVGDPYVGKSFLTMALAIGGILDGRFLDRPVNAERFGFIDLENPKGVVHKRLWDLGIRPGNTSRLSYHHMVELNLARPDAIRTIIATIEEHELDFLCLDSLRRLTPGIKENDSDAMSEVLTPLRLVSARTGCAIVIIHHAKKPGEGGPTSGLMAARGSGDIPASLDTAIFLRGKIGEPGTFTVEHTKNRHGLPEPSFVARITREDDGRVIFEDVGDALSAYDPADDLGGKIVTLLEEQNHPVTRQWIASRLGIESRNRDLADAIKLLTGRLLVTVTKQQGKSNLYVLTANNATLDIEDPAAAGEADERIPLEAWEGIETGKEKPPPATYEQPAPDFPF